MSTLAPLGVDTLPLLPLSVCTDNYFLYFWLFFPSHSHFLFFLQLYILAATKCEQRQVDQLTQKRKKQTKNNRVKHHWNWAAFWGYATGRLEKVVNETLQEKKLDQNKQFIQTSNSSKQVGSSQPTKQGIYPHLKCIKSRHKTSWHLSPVTTIQVPFEITHRRILDSIRNK
jgi:hypothetical protein